MLRTRTALLGMAALATVLGLTAPTTSSATFTSRTTNAASTFTSAADWTPPTVAVTSPGSSVSGSVTVATTAADADSGLASVVLEYLAPGAASWTTLCTATSAPWSCAWDTTKVADGPVSLRATATDRAGYSTQSDPVSTIVANRLTVTLSDPGSFVRGVTALSGAIYGANGVLYTVTVEASPSGTTKWATVCTQRNVGSAFSCAWDTVTGKYAGSYDLRATATATTGGTTFVSAVVPDVTVDNVLPTVATTDPGGTLSGTVTLAAAASDADSGIAQVQLQYAASGTPGPTWTTACTLTTSPYSCRFDTTKLANGRYDVRAVATDAAGNVATSPAITGRTVDNTVSSVAVEDPGAYLTGTVTLRATASAAGGVQSVVIQRALSGTNAWLQVCAITTGTSPYSCPFASTTVADDLYDFRAVLTDTAGRTLTSAVVSARRVDNTALRGYDVQAANGGTSPGRLESGDTLTLTYTDAVKLATITPSFTGATLGVTVRLRDGAGLGLSSQDDTLDVAIGGAVVNLGTVNLREDYVRSGKVVTFAATMSATTVAAGSANRTVVTLRLGASSGGGLRTAATAQAMVWTPASSVTDAYGTACSAAPTTELGTLDRDF